MLLAPGLHPSIQPEDGHFSAVVEALAGPGWCCIEHFLPPEIWQPLAAEARMLYAVGDFRQAGVGRGTSFRILSEVRNDHVRWIDPLAASSLQQAWLAHVEALRLSINAGLMVGLFSYEGHFAMYPDGHFYRRHLDRFADAAQRTVTCILYLNEDWQEADGGALRIYLPEEAGGESFVDIAPKGGTAVIFRSGEFEHEVLPAARDRLSLTGWFCLRR